MHVAFIVNPIAGGGRVRHDWPRIEARLNERGANWTAFWTEEQGHATALTREACAAGFDAVVSVGGDGTLNEVVNGAANTGVPVGIIPLGTGADFPRTAGVPTSPLDALDVVLDGDVKYVDLGRVNDRFFCNVAGTGFDATVAERVNRNGKSQSGAIPYVMALVQTLFSYRNTPITITMDGVTHEVTTLLMAVANGRFFGGGMMICPGADMSDGEFDVCVIGDVGKLKTLFLLPRVFSGSHVEHPEVQVLRGREIHIDGPPHVHIQADGEIIGRLPATFEIKPGALPMLLP